MKKLATAVLLILLIVIFYPLAIIWALNTLFGLSIAYSFVNWLAIIVLKIFLFADKVPSKK